ncbi:MAG: hypothetical protein AVDCRST_MAG30-3927, partial [uncultured Solirubrobacteraceae bacterium]
DPHPRARRRHGDALVRDRGLPCDHRGDPGRRRRRDRQLLDGCDRRVARAAPRLPARAAARRRGAEHGLDELREVLRAPRRVRLPHRLRELVRDDHRFRPRDARAGDPARARVLRLGPRRQPRPADRDGPARRAAADLLRDGRARRDPPDGAQPRAHVRADPGRPGRAEQLGRHRDLARPVAADRRCADPRRQRARRPGGQLLPPRRDDGALQRRPDRAGAAAGGGRRAAGGDRGRGSRPPRHPQAGRRV